MQRLNSTEAKQRILRLLVEFADYCDTNNLEYFLIGGTLLGAARHKGFIPWDDDIDVGMPRFDYERFIELQKKDKVMEIRCAENKTSYFPFAKIVDEKTFVKQPYSDESETSNLWIDIFPFDGWSEEVGQAERDLKKLHKLNWLLIYAQAKIGRGTSKTRMILKVPVALFCKRIGGKRIAAKMNMIAQKYDYDKSNWVGNFSWSQYGMRERVPKEWFTERVKLPFEGYEFWAPKEWDKYLTQIYGDYMTLPPEDQRVNHNMEVWLK